MMKSSLHIRIILFSLFLAYAPISHSIEKERVDMRVTINGEIISELDTVNIKLNVVNTIIIEILNKSKWRDVTDHKHTNIMIITPWNMENLNTGKFRARRSNKYKGNIRNDNDGVIEVWYGISSEPLNNSNIFAAILFHTKIIQ